MPKCKFCRAPNATLKPTGKFSYYCGYECFKGEGIKTLKKITEVRDNAEKRLNKVKKDISNQTVTHWRPKADKAFQLFSRLKCGDDPCISCGRFEHEIKHDARGGKWDGGHYISKGAATELRYSEDNCHKQCKDCNGVKKSGNAVRYRQRLLEKIGPYRLELLEGPHELPRWKWHDYKEVHDWYHTINKQIKKEMDK